MKLRGGMFTLALLFCIGLPAGTFAAEIVFGFDDGTLEGWEYINSEGDPFPFDESDVGWIPSTEAIDIGDGFTMVPATTGDYRIVPEPWENRDCLGALECLTQILRSPTFLLDGSGDLSVDMIGGQGRGGSLPGEEDIPLSPTDFSMFRTADVEATASQGFALRDALTDAYVLFGFSDVENDGKMRDSDPPSRGQWQTVSIPQEELEPFSNNGRSYTVDIYDSYLGGWGWIGFDTVVIPGTVGGTLDFNSDGIVDTIDLNALAASVVAGDNPPQLDLNNDGLVNDADLEQWLAGAATFNGFAEPYRRGDANLDGTVNASDLNNLALRWQSSELVEPWTNGDFTADGVVNAADLNELGLNWQSMIAAAAAVPEPGGLSLLVVGLTLVGFMKRSLIPSFHR
jgi:hypothetical protein